MKEEHRDGDLKDRGRQYKKMRRELGDGTPAHMDIDMIEVKDGRIVMVTETTLRDPDDDPLGRADVHEAYLAGVLRDYLPSWQCQTVCTLAKLCDAIASLILMNEGDAEQMWVCFLTSLRPEWIHFTRPQWKRFLSAL